MRLEVLSSDSPGERIHLLGPRLVDRLSSGKEDIFPGLYRNNRGIARQDRRKQGHYLALQRSGTFARRVGPCRWRARYPRGEESRTYRRFLPEAFRKAFANEKGR